MRSREYGSRKPTQPAGPCTPGGVTVEMPAISVMPKLSCTCRPNCCSKRAASSAGSGEAPVRQKRIDEMSAPSSGTLASAASAVGTADSVVARCFSTSRQ